MGKRTDPTNPCGDPLGIQGIAAKENKLNHPERRPRGADPRILPSSTTISTLRWPSIRVMRSMAMALNWPS